LRDLFTPEHQRIDDDLEVPFFVVDSAAAFPTGVKVQAYSRVVVHDDVIRRPRPGETASYELMKGTRRSNGKPWMAAYDKAGNRVDFNQVREAVLNKYAEKYGNLDPALHDELAKAGSKPTSVALWLLGENPPPEKSTRRQSAKMPAAEAAERRRLFELSSRFVKQYQLGSIDKNVRVDPGAPIVFAELDAETIKRLAAAPEVAMVFYYDKKGIPDLTDSLAISQTDVAHNVGYTGKRVKVAVYESGPDVTTNLDITARFTTDPETSAHARLTHGIIKNIQRNRPHGYAPDCLLHSANAFFLDAIRWAADEGCSVISQSFHREEEETNPNQSFDDLFKDRMVLHWPWPTICEAAGNILSDDSEDEFVNHKGFNRLTVGNHNDLANDMSFDTVFRNPQSEHGDRELPEISANGTRVTAVGVTNSGTSFAAPAVAGAAACIQEANRLLTFWPEGCRAILLASARLNPDGGTWGNDLISEVDARDGTGALNTLNAVRIAEHRRGRNERPAPAGWDVNILRSKDVGLNDEATFSYNISVPKHTSIFTTTVKVALAWDSEIVVRRIHHNLRLVTSELTVDLDLFVFDSNGDDVAHSLSFDNSYEIAEFKARHGETYTIKIRRASGTHDVQYGIAWQTISTSPFGGGGTGGTNPSILQRRRKR